MTKYKSYEEIAKIATELFGDDAEVHYERYGMGWIIATGVLEPVVEFDWEPYKDTPAWEAHNTPDSGGENVLERWARKNGHGYGPMGAIVDAYNTTQAEYVAQHLKRCKDYLAELGISSEGMTDEQAINAAHDAIEFGLQSE